MGLFRTIVMWFIAVAAGSGCSNGAVLPCLDQSALKEFASVAADAPSRMSNVVPLSRLDLKTTPATVHDLNRPARFISLAEAVAIAMENGTVGFQSVRSAGVANDDLVVYTGQDIAGADSIRVLALQPAIAGAAIEGSLARFDPQAFTGILWKTTDEPTQGLSSFSNGHAAAFNMGIAKPLPTGGIAGLSFLTDYTLLSNPPSGGFSVLNPSYFTRLQFGFEQPLLRDYGVGINQLLPSFPGSGLFPALNARSGAGTGILIARLRFDSQRAEFERRLTHLLLNVEVAYWKLYGAYVSLYSTEQALRMATEVWRIAKEQFPEKIDDGDYAGTRGELQLFRGNRLQAVGAVLNAERDLRLLLGMKVEDGERLAPIDQPNVSPVKHDWHAALYDALHRRPELMLVRMDIENKRLNVIAQSNGLKPDLRFAATYTVVGLGSRLDGNGEFVGADGISATNNSLRSLAGTHYNDWSLGLNLNMPLGFRQEHAGMRQAKLQMAQSISTLHEQEAKAETLLARQYSRVEEAFAVIEMRRQQRVAFADQVEVRFRKFAAGKISVDFLQDAVRRWSSALSTEYEAIVEYNNALAAFEFAKGTILDYDKVYIAEGPLPECAQVRAVEHERTQTRRLAAQLHGKKVNYVPGVPEMAVGAVADLPIPSDGNSKLLGLVESSASAQHLPVAAIAGIDSAQAPTVPLPLPVPLPPMARPLFNSRQESAVQAALPHQADDPEVIVLPTVIEGPFPVLQPPSVRINIGVVATPQDPPTAPPIPRPSLGIPSTVPAAIAEKK